MKTQADQPSFLTLLIVGIAVILFGTAGFARMMGWGAMLSDGSGGILALDQTVPAAASEARAGPTCPECGMIVSIREIERHGENSGPGSAGGAMAGNRNETRVKSARSLEIAVRMADGSSRVISDPEPARWRTGERLIVIDGFSPPAR